MSGVGPHPAMATTEASAADTAITTRPLGISIRNVRIGS
jgi:hypothetical protein